MYRVEWYAVPAPAAALPVALAGALTLLTPWTPAAGVAGVPDDADEDALGRRPPPHCPGRGPGGGGGGGGGGGVDHALRAAGGLPAAATTAATTFTITGVPAGRGIVVRVTAGVVAPGAPGGVAWGPPSPPSPPLPTLTAAEEAAVREGAAIRAARVGASATAYAARKAAAVGGGEWAE